MANEKFEPTENISDIEIRLECLRLATEFGPEYERKDPINVAVAPKQINTIEKPNVNKIIGNKLILFLAKSSFKEEPEI